MVTEKTGQQLVDWARPHAQRNEQYVLGAWAPKWNANYQGPWDCAEFVSAGVFQCYGFLKGVADNLGDVYDPEATDAYTGYWARDVDLGAVIAIGINYAIHTPGAILLRRPKSGHIVICVGDGVHTIEAANSKAGVIIGNVGGRRWDDGILIPGVEYRRVVQASPYESMSTLRLTSPYMRGETVRSVQKALQKFNFNLTADGVYGPVTMAAVKEFQMSLGLTPDGEVGPLTAKALGIDWR